MTEVWPINHHQGHQNQGGTFIGVVSRIAKATTIPEINAYTVSGQYSQENLQNWFHHGFKLKCIKFDFRWGSAPDPLGELTALPHTPDSLAVFEGAYF